MDKLTATNLLAWLPSTSSEAEVKAIFKNQTGSYLEIIDWPTVTGIFFGTIACYFVLWYLSDFLLMKSGAEFYVTRDLKSKINWRNLALNNVNNCIVIVWAILNLQYGCPEFGWTGWFTNDECFLRPYVGIAYALAYMNGFLVFDFLCLLLIFP